MATPSSFIPDGAPASFEPDAPTSFVADSGTTSTATNEADALLAAQTPITGTGPSFMTAPAPTTNPRDIALESRERRGPEIGSGTPGEPIPDPDARQRPSLLSEIGVAPVGLGTFSKLDGKTISPGSELARARDLAAGEGRAPIGLPTLSSELLSLLPEGKIKDLSTGAYNAAAGLFNFFISPMGVAALGIGGLPPMAQKAVTATFAYDMAKNAPEELAAGDEAMKQGDIQGATQHWLSGAAAIGFAVGAGKHTISPIKPKAPPVISPELEQLAPQTARAVEETLKPNEPKPADETKTPATVSEIETPAEATAEVKAPAAADVANEVAKLPENVGGTLGGASENLPAEAQAIEAQNKAKQRQIAEEFKRANATPKATLEKGQRVRWSPKSELDKRAFGEIEGYVISDGGKRRVLGLVDDAGKNHYVFPEAGDITLVRPADTAGIAAVDETIRRAFEFLKNWKWKGADPGKTYEEYRRSGRVSSSTDAAVRQAIIEARKNGPSPEFRSLFGGIDPQLAGSTPEKVKAFAKTLGIDWNPVPSPSVNAPKEPLAAAGETTPVGVEQTPAAAGEKQPWEMTFPQWMNKGERQIQMTRAEVAQPLPQPSIKLNVETFDGGKTVTASPYLLPGYKGPTLAVVEYKSPKGRPQERGYRVYAKDSGVLIEDSNGVSTLNDTLKQAVQRIASYQSKTGQTGFQMVHRQVLQRAIREGKLVPAEALADYPDLAPKLPSEPEGGQPARPTEPKEGGEIVGMGGAVPSEFERRFRTSTGVKKAAITEAREERGAEPAEIKAGKQPQQKVHDRVMKQLDEDPAWPDRLVSELSEKPRALNADEVLVLDTRYVDLQNEYRKATDEAIQAEADGRVDAVLEGKRKADYWEQKLTDFEIMARATGTHWGRTGAMMQRRMKADFSLEAMERRARAAKNFEPLTPEEHAKVKAFNEELQAKVKALEERQKAVIDEAVKEALDRVEAESKTKQPAYHPRVLKAAERFATFMDNQADSALSRIRERRSRMTSGVDPTELADLSIIGAAKITRGLVELAKWSDAMIRDVGDWIKPHLDEIFKASQAKFESETNALDKKLGATMAERVRKAIKPSDPKSIREDVADKIKTKVDSGEMDITPFVHKLARGFIEAGIKEREPLIDAVHAVLKDILPDHTRRDTMDAISGYGKFSRLTKDDISVTLRDLKGQMQQLAKLEDMAAGTAPLKTGIERRSPSDAERQLIQQVNEAKKRGGYEVTNPELQLASALSTRLTAIRNRIADLSDEISKGERNVPERKTPPTSPEIESAKKQLAELREEHAKVFGLALQKLKTGIAKRISTLEKRMAEKDFAPRPKKPAPESDAELLKLKGDLERVQEQYQGMLEQWKFQQLGIFGKATKIAGAMWDSARNIITTGELSYTLRQGKAFVLSRPVMATRAFALSMRAFASERVARAAELRIRGEPEYPASQTAKLHISRESDSLTRQEELIMGRWGRAIPVIKNFNRAAVTFLNELRWESWLAMRKTFSRGGKSTPAEDIQFAKMANEATGRGGLGFAEPAAVTLGRVFFAPRYLASRIQMAVGHSMWGGTARSRAVIATEYARILTGYFVYLNLLQIGLNALLPDDKKVKVSFDPRSADFGKIVIGNTRLDIMAGLAQLATFAGRSITGETKNAKGQVTPIRPKDGKKVPFGKPNWYDVAGRFVLSKTHPLVSTVGNLLNGVDLIGNESSLATETGKLLGPITYVDIYQALRAQGLDEGSALAILAFLGEGLQTYRPKKQNEIIKTLN